ncbi:EF-hand domain-containing family member A2 [Tupaia chinensis]|uniref:EF-hand domain-containing family member A2 n=1 Tax=Tupaia chinensis TaxID=246437 RepID=L9KR94_TUPCH|nr:EF-hand domain-containing family member A2 [Tupaia chinensis]
MGKMVDSFECGTGKPSVVYPSTLGSRPKEMKIQEKKQELNQMLSETPPVWKGSSKLFRNLKEKEPHAGFRIAFNMFDTDGNEMVDKKEFLVLQEIFRKKNEKRETKGDEEKRAMLVLRTDAEELVPRSYWDTLRRSTSQALFSDLAERADDITSLVTDTTLLVHFFGKKGKAELNFEDFYRFMDNLQTEVLEIEFLSYSNGMNTISEEDFAHILLRYTNVENTSVFLENVRYSIPEEKGITFDEFRSFFQFLNNLEDFAIALNMYNFASRSIGQDEFKRAVYVATGLKLSPHLVNTVFKIFDVDKDDQLSYKEFIGIMKDRLHRGFRFHLSYAEKELLEREPRGEAHQEVLRRAAKDLPIYTRTMSGEAFRSPVFRHGTDKNGFSLGFSKNMRQVFGDEKKYWLLPIFSRYQCSKEVDGRDCPRQGPLATCSCIPSADYAEHD